MAARRTPPVTCLSLDAETPGPGSHGTPTDAPPRCLRRPTAAQQRGPVHRRTPTQMPKQPALLGPRAREERREMPRRVLAEDPMSDRER
nr:unnamed protein product [Digitaria exilis]